MSTKSILSPSFDLDEPGSSSAMPAEAAIALKLLHRLKHGVLQLDLPDGRSLRFGEGARTVTVAMRSWAPFGAIMKAGDIGFGESFIDGDWTTDDLPGLLELLARNRREIDALIYGRWWGGMWHRLRHLFRRNTKAGSRRNIHAHYDIGNDFYRLWLDPSMTYSSALFGSEHGRSLQDAQTAKYRRLLDALRVAPQERVLEIGCGWGGFAEIAARTRQVFVTGLTLSAEQLHYARQRFTDAGISSQVDLRLCDYRDMHGEFDAIASIEMFEAVGEAYWPDYFACVARNLKRGGRACIQTIVIGDELFARYRKGTDFIQQYIFPGGMLPSPSAFRRAAERSGLGVIDDFRFGLDYARTLHEWRKAFNEHHAQVRLLGFDDRFLRTWEFYLAYCEAGFRAGSIDVVQFTLEKP
jgi:cyclopropane-fatty-acyl-phospholipid synthase